MTRASFGEVFNEKVDPVVWLITSAHNHQRGGLIATFVANASLVPEEPRVIIGIAKHHFSWNLIERSRAFAIHLVDCNQLDCVRRFGLRSGYEADKMHDLTLAVGETGSPLFLDADLWADCCIEASMDTGDRTIYLARIVSYGRGTPGCPLTVSHMVCTLQQTDRAELDRRRAADILLDAAAIRKWRADCQNVVATAARAHRAN